eukprot:scaffold8300_cov171-Amphora_coffeaeformis.AAC.8
MYSSSAIKLIGDIVQWADVSIITNKRTNIMVMFSAVGRNVQYPTVIARMYEQIVLGSTLFRTFIKVLMTTSKQVTTNFC